MKPTLNEQLARMQKIAGIIKENQINEAKKINLTPVQKKEFFDAIEDLSAQEDFEYALGEAGNVLANILTNGEAEYIEDVEDFGYDAEEVEQYAMDLAGESELDENQVNEARTYYHVLEDGGYGNIGHQGVYNTEEEAQKRADELTDMFPRSTFYVEASNSRREPVNITMENQTNESTGNEIEVAFQASPKMVPWDTIEKTYVESGLTGEEFFSNVEDEFRSEFENKLVNRDAYYEFFTKRFTDGQDNLYTMVNWINLTDPKLADKLYNTQLNEATGNDAIDYTVKILNNFKRSNPFDASTILKKAKSLKNYIENQYDTEEIGAEMAYTALDDLIDALNNGDDVMATIDNAIAELNLKENQKSNKEKIVTVSNLSNIDYVKVVKFLQNQFNSLNWDIDVHPDKSFEIDIKNLSKTEQEDLMNYLKSQNLIEENQDYYKDAEKDDAAHIDALEKDMKDDAKHTSKDKMTRSAFKAKIKEMILAELNEDSTQDQEITDDNSDYDPLDEAKGHNAESLFKMFKEKDLIDDRREYDAEDLMKAYPGLSKEEAEKLEHMLQNLDEAKKDKEEIEDVTIDDTEITDAPEADVTSNETAEVSGIQSNLQAAYAEAKALGDEKLITQIANTITYFTKAHILDTAPINESMFPMLKRILK